jgi:hypothetical protein
MDFVRTDNPKYQDLADEANRLADRVFIYRDRRNHTELNADFSNTRILIGSKQRFMGNCLGLFERSEGEPASIFGIKVIFVYMEDCQEMVEIAA